jgi:prolyl-tRNA editing enzyme YbaK/EbsC (Cys-tRNA(Pro) deacylase)
MASDAIPEPIRADARLAAVPEPPSGSPTRRVLDAAAEKGVALDIRAFDTPTHTAAEAAAAVGVELGQIVKSLVFVVPDPSGGLEPILCLVSGSNRVDVERLATVIDAPDVRRATAAEARDLTGFVIGGIPPVGHARPVRVVMDPDLEQFPVVWAAAGTSRDNFPIAPDTLATLSGALVAPIAERPAPDGPRRAA